MLAELQSPPPRQPGPLLKPSLSRAREGQYGVIFFIVFIIGGIDAMGLYARSQGVPGMSNLYALGTVVVGAALIFVSWLFQTRPLTQTVRALYRDGLIFEARVQSVSRGGRRKVAFAVFKYEAQDLVVLADMGGIKVQEGDACQALYDPKTGLGCIVWNDKYLVTGNTATSRRARKSG
jgi:hypothetical protein